MKLCVFSEDLRKPRAESGLSREAPSIAPGDGATKIILNTKGSVSIAS